MPDEPSLPTDERTPVRRSRMAPFIAVAIAVVCGALFFVLAGAKNSRSESDETPLMGQPAPESIGELDDGSTFDLSRRKGSWVVLNFFDSNCQPCVLEHPALVGFAESQDVLGGQGAELITVVYGDDPDGVREFFADNGGVWPVVFDDDGSISAAFGVNLVPETWILDPDGVIRWRTISPVSTDQLNQVVSDLRTVRGMTPHINTRLKGIPGWLGLLFVAVALLVIGATADRGSTTPVERAQALERRLACPVCDGESLFESRNQAAVNLRNEIETLVNTGQLSDGEIIARIESRLNESLLLLPKSTGIDGLVWALPAAAFVCAVAGLALVFRRWRLASATDNAPTDEDRALVAAALGEPPGDGD